LVRIRITRRLANTLNGIDLSRVHVGDVVDLSDWDARVLVAEGWGERVASGTRAPVLIVEDDDDLRRMMAEWLRGQGHPVVEARDGREGLAKLVAFKPAVVLLDLKMPRMSGRQFRRLQRRLEDSSLASIPVIVVSGLPDATEQAKVLDATDIIEKPVDLPRLTSIVARQLEA
jgi:CheY-like chemotaxis protein